VATIIRRGIGLTTGFIGSHTVTITVYTLLQLTTVHYNTCRVFTLYLHPLPLFQIAGSVRLQLCNSSLKTAARPEYSLVTRELVTAGVVTVELSA
jgi:hypothetical protein